ncbi:MAG: hypothetical protein J6P44_02280 [Bacteroidales bacterium]|nr:hypothetical protein [Bacteroidales bacterium]
MGLFKKKKKEIKEELTTEMHAEFEIDEETKIKHKAWRIWDMNKIDPFTDEEIKRQCASFGITYEQLMKYKP